MQQSPGTVLKVLASTEWYMENSQEFLRRYIPPPKKATDRVEKGVITYGSGQRIQMAYPHLHLLQMSNQ